MFEHGLVKFFPAVAYCLCLNKPATFSQPRAIISRPSGGGEHLDVIFEIPRVDVLGLQPSASAVCLKGGDRGIKGPDSQRSGENRKA